jgi:biopolymer transport protein ExbD
MQVTSGYENRRARIELLPMIDVVFLLLVFFIYAMLSMVVHRGMKVDLPAGSTAQLDKRQYVSISLDADNAIRVQDQVVTLDEVAAAVQRHRADSADLPVFIAGDQHADLGLALQILDRLRQVHINEVSFEMDRNSQ